MDSQNCPSDEFTFDWSTRNPLYELYTISFFKSLSCGPFSKPRQVRGMYPISSVPLGSHVTFTPRQTLIVLRFVPTSCLRRLDLFSFVLLENSSDMSWYYWRTGSEIRWIPRRWLVILVSIEGDTPSSLSLSSRIERENGGCRGQEGRSRVREGTVGWVSTYSVGSVTTIHVRDFSLSRLISVEDGKSISRGSNKGNILILLLIYFSMFSRAITWTVVHHKTTMSREST